MTPFYYYWKSGLKNVRFLKFKVNNNYQTLILLKFPIFKNISEANFNILASDLILIRKVYCNNKFKKISFYLASSKRNRWKENNHQTKILVKFSISKNVTKTNNFLLASVLILSRKIYHKLYFIITNNIQAMRYFGDITIRYCGHGCWNYNWDDHDKKLRQILEF